MEAINGLREKLGGSTLFDNGLRQASSGAVIGLHVRTTSTLNSLNSLRRVLNESVKKESLTERTWLTAPCALDSNPPMRLTLHHSWPLPQKIFAKSLQFSVFFFFSLMILCYLCTHIYNRYYPMAKIKVQNTEITIVSHNDDDYISLTDMARSQLQESRMKRLLQQLISLVAILWKVNFQKWGKKHKESIL